MEIKKQAKTLELFSPISPYFPYVVCGFYKSILGAIAGLEVRAILACRGELPRACLGAGNSDMGSGLRGTSCASQGFPFWEGSFEWGSRFRSQINPKTQL